MMQSFTRAMWDTLGVRLVFFAVYDGKTHERIDTSEAILFPGTPETLPETKRFLLSMVEKESAEEIIANEFWLNALPPEKVDATRRFSCHMVLPEHSVSSVVRMHFGRFFYKGGGPFICLAIEDLGKDSDTSAEKKGRDPKRDILTKTEWEAFCEKKRREGVKFRSVNAMLVIRLDDPSHKSGYIGMEEWNRTTRKIERTLSEEISGDVIVVKISGECYVMIRHGRKSLEGIREEAEELCRKLCADEDGYHKTTVSIGVSLCRHEEENGCKTAYDLAEEACRLAQEHGGDRVFFHNGEKVIGKENRKPKKRVFIRTFGRFDVFVEDRPILFRHEKAKELMALLVDRQGGFVKSGDAIGCLWEDEPVSERTKARYRKAAMWLARELEEAGVEEILEKSGSARRLRTEEVECDLYLYLSREEKYAHMFKGAYLTDYSWAEMTAADLNKDLWK